MPSPETLDFKQLLAPIPGENPSGELLRYTGLYDAIQEARRSDDVLPQGEWKREIKTADWAGVLEMATEALSIRSKDLQIAAWLVEGLVKRHGFAGLRDGLWLLRELQERFWASLYPEVENGELEFRAGPLAWLNEKLPVSIREVPLTEGEESYSWHHWEESRAVDNLGRQSPEALAAALAEGKITGDQFDKAVMATPRAFYEVLFQDLNGSREELDRLDRVVEEKFSRDAPSLRNINKAIEDCRGLVEGVVKKKRELDPSYKREEESKVAGMYEQERPAEGEPMAGHFSLEPTSREDAFRRLAAIADYLMRTEPQSPVSYLVERAVCWARMPLGEWLSEVVHNEDVLKHLRDTLGIKGRQDS